MTLCHNWFMMLTKVDVATTRLVILCVTVLVGVIVVALVVLEAMGNHTSATTYASYLSRGVMALVPILVTIYTTSKISKGVNANSEVTSSTADATHEVAEMVKAKL